MNFGCAAGTSIAFPGFLYSSLGTLALRLQKEYHRYVRLRLCALHFLPHRGCIAADERQIVKIEMDCPWRDFLCDCLVRNRLRFVVAA